MTKRTKRPIAMLLAVLMVLGCFGSMTAGATGENQIKGDGGTTYWKADGSEVKTGDPVVGKAGVVISTSKTIAKTDVENEFEITLEVKTTVEVSEIKPSADLATVLVIDNSGSMNDNNRLANAKTAAKAFLESYVKNVSEGDVRYISLVTFGGTSKVSGKNTSYYGYTEVVKINGTAWVDVSITENYNAVVKAIEAVKAADGTFLQGGLTLARNLFSTINTPKVNGEAVPNRYVVLLTDGNPTHYDTGDYTGIDSWTGNTTGGTEDSTNIPPSRAKAQSVATTIKNGASGYNSAKIYTVALSTSSTKYGTGISGENNTTMDAADWLAGRIATNSTYAYTATDYTGLIKAFTNISETITSLAKAWEVADPMGSDIIYGGSTTPGTSYAVFDDSDNTLTWKLHEMNGDYDENSRIYTYRYTYKVTLNTLASDFVAETSVATNGTTTLSYFMTANIDDKVDVSTILKTATFKIPAVQGFAGDITFTKVDDLGTALAGAKFKIEHDDANCGCGLTGFTSYEVESGTGAALGKVTFANIPSGHDYTIVETKTTTDHVLNTEKIGVGVSWGVATVTSGLTDGKFVNDRVQHNVTVNYYIDGTNVATPYGPTPYANGGVFSDNVSGYFAGSITGAGVPGGGYTFMYATYWVNGTQVTGGRFNTLADLNTYVAENGTMGDYDIVINLHYGNFDALSISLIKSIKLTDKAMQYPGDYTFEFKLTDQLGTTTYATLTLTQDDFTSGNFKNASFEWNSAVVTGFADVLGKTLYLTETTTDSDWSSSWNGGKYVSIDADTAALTYYNSNGKAVSGPKTIVNTYTQQPGSVTITGEKFFSLAEGMDIDDFLDNIMFDGSVCGGHEVGILHEHIEGECEEICILDGEEGHVCDGTECELEYVNCPEYDGVATVYDEDCDEDCRTYTFEFQLLKWNGEAYVDAGYDYFPITRTADDIAKLLESGDSEDIIFNVTAGTGSDRYKIVEVANGYIGWTANGAIVATVPAYGNVTATVDGAIGNEFGGAAKPTITINKTLLSTRDNLLYTVADDESFTFTFGIYSDADCENLIKEVEIPIGEGYDSGSISVNLDSFYGGSGSVWVKEIDDGQLDVTYDTTPYEIVIVDGEVVENDEVYFENSYFNPITPEIEISKTANNENSGEEFTIWYQIDDGETPIIDSVNLKAGGSETIRFKTNFTGTVTVWEEDGGLTDWTYDGTVYTFEFEDGVLDEKKIDDDSASDLYLTANFNNTYTYNAGITVTKASDNGESTVVPGAEVEYTLVVENSGTDALVNVSLTDALNGDNPFEDDAVRATVMIDGVAATDDDFDAYFNLIIGSLAVDESVMITYKVTLENEGRYENNVVVAGTGSVTETEVDDDDNKTIDVEDPYNPNPESSTLTKTVYNARYTGTGSVEDVAKFIAGNNWTTGFSATGLSSGTTSIDVIFKVEISDPDGLLNPVSYGDNFKNGTLTFIGVLADGVIVENYADAAAAIADLGTNITLIYKGTVTVTGTTNTTYTNVAAIGFNEGVEADDLTSNATVTVSRRSGGGYTPPENPDDPPVDIIEEDPPLGGADPDDPAIDIIDEDPPLTETPAVSEVQIEEEEVPLDDIPQTGDTAMLAFLLVMATLSAGGLIVLTLKTRKSTGTR